MPAPTREWETALVMDTKVHASAWQRFLTGWEEEPSGCWIWQRTRNLRGYGELWVFGHMRYAHRVAWILAVEEPIGDLQIDHLCCRPSCVNPEHLEAVTASTNVRRSYAPSFIAAFHRAKTHCPHGHPYDEANTFLDPKGHRGCRTCRRRNYTEYRKRKRAT